MSWIRELWAELRDLVRQLHPDRLDAAIHRWLIRLHHPIDVGEPEYTWCPTCRTTWPCDELLRLAPDEEDV